MTFMEGPPVSPPTVSEAEVRRCQAKTGRDRPGPVRGEGAVGDDAEWVESKPERVRLASAFALAADSASSTPPGIRAIG